MELFTQSNSMKGAKDERIDDGDGDEELRRNVYGQMILITLKFFAITNDFC